MSGCCAPTHPPPQRWATMVTDSRLGFEMYEALPHLCKPLT